MKEKIRENLKESGAVAVAFARAGEIDSEDFLRYSKWIEGGNHATMEYLNRNSSLRQHTDKVLAGAKTVISLAFSYVPNIWRDLAKPGVAVYAYGEDYHKVVNKKLRPIVTELKEEFGGEWRVCVDSAPVAERYWAIKSGLGSLTKSGNIWVEGAGTMCFLVEILTTIPIETDLPTDPDVNICEDCQVCIDNCPGNTLFQNPIMNASRCVSFLTIEKKGDFNSDEIKSLKSGIYKKGFLFGCDLCVRLCRLNRNLNPTAVKEFLPREDILNITGKDVLKMEENEFYSKFRGSPIKRAKMEGLKRNARYCS